MVVLHCTINVYIVIDSMIMDKPNNSKEPVIDSCRNIADRITEQIIRTPLKLEYIPGPTCLINCICCVEPIV